MKELEESMSSHHGKALSKAEKDLHSKFEEMIQSTYNNHAMTWDEMRWDDMRWDEVAVYKAQFTLPVEEMSGGAHNAFLPLQWNHTKGNTQILTIVIYVIEYTNLTTSRKY